MFKRYYHCFIAGLPDLAFEESKFSTTMQQFKQELEHELSPGDYDLVRLFFLPYDHENLINFLLKKESTAHPLGNFTIEDFEEQAIRLKAILKQEDLLPAYMVNFMVDFYNEETVQGEDHYERILMTGYYDYVSKAGNPFVRRWFAFERDARNILTALICKKYDLPVEQEIIGDNELAHDLMRSKHKSGEIMTDDDFLQEVVHLTGVEDFYERERRYDMLKWEYINEHTFFFYFTIEKIIGYLIKLFIVFRWKELDKETGKKMFEKLIEELRSSYALPEEFSLIKR